MTTIGSARRNAKRQAKRLAEGKEWHGNPYDWNTDRKAHNHWAKWFIRMRGYRDNRHLIGMVTGDTNSYRR
jgi:hypothetical protein